MKKLVFLAAAMLVFAFSAKAQSQKPTIQWPDYQFQTIKENPITPVKNQASSGTCWAFSTIGFFESEVIRINNIKDPAKYPDFSEFFVVSKSYADRALKYVLLDGNLTFGAGSEADDVLHIVEDYGFVPQEAMTGMNYGTALPAQAEMDAVLKAYVQAVAKVPNRSLTTAWHRGFKAILDEYLGKCPETFTVDGKEYTPASYRDALKFNPDDYVTLASFTHHPFYQQFAFEVCDNWRWDKAYNLPMDEFMQVLDYALENGYTAAWGTDVSETGFTRDGYAILVDAAKLPAPGSDQEHWVGKEEGKPQPIPVPEEKVATQETHQQCFMNKTVTDDHGMQIYGIAKDQFGKKYYMVKNSWGTSSKFKGIWYATGNYIINQSIDIMVHKDAVPKEIKKKLGIK